MKKGDDQKYMVHPILGVTSTKRWHMPVTFILLKEERGFTSATESCHHILLNLTGFSQGVFLKIPSIRILHRTIYLCIFIDNVPEIQCIDILLIYSNILKNRTLFLWGFYNTLYISLFDCFPHHMNFIQNVYIYKPLYI